MDALTFSPKLSAPVFSTPSRSTNGPSPAFLVPFPLQFSASPRHAVKVYCSKAAAESITKKLPPGPMKLPLIGNLHNLIGSPLPHHALTDLAKDHGPLMHLQLGEISAVVVSSPDMAEEVFKNQDLNFSQRPQFLASKVTTYDGQDIVMAPYGDYWKQMRKVSTTELLTPKRVQSFSSIRTDEVSNLLEYIRSTVGTPINFSEKAFLLTNRVTCRAAFGSKCSEEDQATVIEAMDGITESAGGFHFVDLFPSLEFLQGISGIKAKLEGLRDRLDKVFDRIIDEHKEKLLNHGCESGDDDLLDVILRLQGSGSLQCPITSKALKAVILDVFIAGTDTSSVTTEWAMAEMMKNPIVFKKAQAEVRQAFKGKKTITEADVQELTYIKYVVKEALRLHPPAPLLVPRDTREDCEINGYRVPAKTKLIVNAWAIGRDPKYWSDPESFKPERFENNLVDFKGQHFQFIPFGAGRRMCPGITFGLANIEYPLAQLLYHFDWKLPHGVTPENFDMSEKFGVTAGRKSDLYLIATPHKSSQDDSTEHMEAMKVLN
uniref:Uncharacterized protein MANES_11G098600 n=1 Tax=Rhizophora mucronata TaxID=61149 RepID=A0A2P2NYX6_RHIMU